MKFRHQPARGTTRGSVKVYIPIGLCVTTKPTNGPTVYETSEGEKCLVTLMMRQHAAGLAKYHLVTLCMIRYYCLPSVT